MAVEAQYPSATPTAATGTAILSPEHGLNPKVAPRLQGGGVPPLGSRRPSAAPKLQPEAFNSTTMHSGDPGSELTCNAASGKRKRGVNQYQSTGFLHPLQHNHHQPLRGMDGVVAGDQVGPGNAHGASWGALLSGGSHAPYKNISRSCDSAVASTTGRPPAEAPILPDVAVPSPATSSLLTHQLVLQLHHQRVDIDDLIRLQSKRLCSELEQMRDRHCRALLSAMHHGVLRHLRQKVMELESAKRRNAELEDKVQQMVAENDMWLNVARNSEAIASSLRASLEQVLLKNASPAGAVDLEEGYGDSGSVTSTTPRVPEETQPCFHHGDPGAEVAAEEEGRRGKQGKCRVCSEGEVSVLVLPCRHLCLCDKCEPRVAACPLCKAAINATLHVFFA